MVWNPAAVPPGLGIWDRTTSGAYPGCWFNRRVREAERNAPFLESVRKWCVPLALHTPYLNHSINRPGGAAVPEFTYIARTISGQDVKGLISADSRGDVMALLNQRSLFPMTVTPAKQPLLKFNFNRSVKAELLASTLTQLSDLLTNGVPLLQALDLIAQQATHEHLKEVLTDVRSQIAEGKQLHEAMGAHRDVFSDLTLSVIRAGTEGAFLEAALQQTAERFARERLLPDYQKREKLGLLDRALVREMGGLGLLGADLPTEYGGLGVDSVTTGILPDRDIARLIDGGRISAESTLGLGATFTVWLLRDPEMQEQGASSG